MGRKLEKPLEEVTEEEKRKNLRYQIMEVAKQVPEAKAEKKADFTVVEFDGKGVPMIKKEGAKLKGRQGKGEKKQKKKYSS